MQVMCLHAGFYPGPGPRTARDLCPSGFYNALALCPAEFECTHHDNCSSETVCCPNFCGTSTCVAPWIKEVSATSAFQLGIPNIKHVTREIRGGNQVGFSGSG